MTTANENERLGVLETKVTGIERDVAEIKSDVKIIVASQQAVAVKLAAREAAEAASSQSRSSNGVWVRFLLERGIALAALAVSLYALLTK